jgi:hypothetical protein
VGSASFGGLASDRLPKESDEERSVSGEFVLKALLDSRWSEAPSSLILKNAIITTPVEAVYAKVEADLEARDCLFKTAIKLPRAQAARRLRFFGCVFADAIDLRGSHFAELIFGPSEDATPASSGGPVDFSYTDIASTVDCSGAHFNHAASVAYFGGAAVRGDAVFEGAELRGGMSLAGATIGGQLRCSNASFLSEGARGQLQRGQGAGHLLSAATFQGPVNGGYADITINLEGGKARFLGG